MQLEAVKKETFDQFAVMFHAPVIFKTNNMNFFLVYHIISSITSKQLWVSSIFPWNQLTSFCLSCKYFTLFSGMVITVSKKR